MSRQVPTSDHDRGAGYSPAGMMKCMTDDVTIVQARIPVSDVRRLDHDVQALGLRSRSDAVREGLRLLHREARHAALASDYDLFYRDVHVPLDGIAAVGDKVAAETMTTLRAR